MRAIEAEVSREVARIRAEHQDRKPEHRCRVCQHPDSLDKVNRLLAIGMSWTDIERQVADINEKRSRNNKITYNSIRNHSNNHFDLQKPANAAYRRILERRAAEVGDQFGEGVERLLTAMGYLDVVAHKGFETLMRDDTTVGYTTGLEAILKLEELQRATSTDSDMAEIRRKVTALYTVVKEVVPSQYWTEIDRRLAEMESGESSRVVDAEVIDDEDDDEEFDPIIEHDDEDSLED